jgi:hypothetical protein
MYYNEIKLTLCSTKQHALKLGGGTTPRFLNLGNGLSMYIHVSVDPGAQCWACPAVGLETVAPCRFSFVCLCNNSWRLQLLPLLLCNVTWEGKRSYASEGRRVGKKTWCDVQKERLIYCTIHSSKWIIRAKLCEKKCTCCYKLHQRSFLQSLLATQCCIFLHEINSVWMRKYVNLFCMKMKNYSGAMVKGRKS